MMPMRAKRINASIINMTIIIIGLSPPFAHRSIPNKLAQLNPPSQQAVVGGKQLQFGKQPHSGISGTQLQFPPPGLLAPGQGVGTKKQQMNPGQYVS